MGEAEEAMRVKYPYLFPVLGKQFRGRKFLLVGEIVNTNAFSMHLYAYSYLYIYA